jgi:hypothetical protein
LRKTRAPEKRRSAKATTPAAMPPFAPAESGEEGGAAVAVAVAVAAAAVVVPPSQKNVPPTLASLDSCWKGPQSSGSELWIKTSPTILFRAGKPEILYKELDLAYTKAQCTSEGILISYPLKDPVIFKVPFINPRFGADRDRKLALVIQNDPFTMLRAGIKSSEQFGRLIDPPVAMRFGRLILIVEGLSSTVKVPIPSNEILLERVMIVSVIRRLSRLNGLAMKYTPPGEDVKLSIDVREVLVIPIPLGLPVVPDGIFRSVSDGVSAIRNQSPPF